MLCLQRKVHSAKVVMSKCFQHFNGAVNTIIVNSVIKKIALIKRKGISKMNAKTEIRTQKDLSTNVNKVHIIKKFFELEIKKCRLFRTTYKTAKILLIFLCFCCVNKVNFPNFAGFWVSVVNFLVVLKV